jgi:hypothetical protein
MIIPCKYKDLFVSYGMTMFISSMLCPTCKKGEMEEKSVITGMLNSNSDINT